MFYQLSVLKGETGKPLLLNRLGIDTSVKPNLTASGFLIFLLNTTSLFLSNLNSAGTNFLELSAINKSVILLPFTCNLPTK